MELYTGVIMLLDLGEVQVHDLGARRGSVCEEALKLGRGQRQEIHYRLIS